MGQGEGGGGGSEIMINSLILILNKEEKPMTRGSGVDFGQNFDDVIFEQPLIKEEN